MLVSNLLGHYAAAIRRLPMDRPLSKEDLLVDDFLLHREDRMEVYYSPHNEYINRQARVVIIGITPGWTQMEIALRTARAGLAQGLSAETICREAKAAARFAGTMRKNLTDMLNALELHRYFDRPSCEALFADGESLLHTTSVLRYPVFIDKRNYNGHSPAVQSSPALSKMAMEAVPRELALLRRPLLIPLGKTVEAVLRTLCSDGLVDQGHCLWGFPHPSGANGHRHKQLAAGMNAMKACLAAFGDYNKIQKSD